MDAEGDKEKAQAPYIKHQIQRIKNNDNMAIAWEQKNGQESKPTNDGVSGPMFVFLAVLVMIAITLLSAEI